MFQIADQMCKAGESENSQTSDKTHPKHVDWKKLLDITHWAMKEPVKSIGFKRWGRRKKVHWNINILYILSEKKSIKLLPEYIMANALPT